MSVTSPFVFGLCAEGAEGALRQELLEQGLKPAYARPGFVTARVEGEALSLDAPLQSVFARRLVLSFGKQKSVDDVKDELGATLVHVVGARTQKRDPQPGEVVVTSVRVDSDVWVGAHRHRRGISPDVGGDPGLVAPPHAPSRAWCKIEEAIRRFGLDVAAGMRVLEIGSAPGGVSQALLDRGCSVVGVDPNEMDPRVLSRPGFRHLQTSVIHLRERDIGGPVECLVVDINQPPHAVLDRVAPLCQGLRAGLTVAVFTLKLPRWELVRELPKWRERLEGLLRMETFAAQLPSNRQELCVVAVR